MSLEDGVSKFGIPVAEGRWLYDCSVPAAVRVLQSEVRFGTGDHEHEPEWANDRPGRCFYVEWSYVGGPVVAASGPFETLEQAKVGVERFAHPVVWSAM